MSDDNTSFQGGSEVYTGKVSLQSQEIPYAYFVHYCNLESVWNVMIKEWNLKIPKITLFMVSDIDASSTWLNFKQQEKFVKGLVKASNATSMWILTNGLNFGMSKAIGDALQVDYSNRFAQFSYSHAGNKEEVKKTPLIGVCRDTMLTYYDKFKCKTTGQDKSISLQNEGNRLEKNQFDLNPHHTNFLLIHDKTTHKNGVNRFLLKLEDAFRGFHTGTSGDAMSRLVPSPVPLIAVLVKGNLHSAHYVLAHLKHRLPVLVIRGSGGLADVLAYAYYEVHRSFQKIKDLDYLENVLKQSLGEKIKTVFPSLKDNKMAHSVLCSRVLECIEAAEPPKLKYITVFNILDLSSDVEELPNHLLEAIFRAKDSDTASNHDQLKRDLLLTIDWNCPHLAETKVFFKDSSFKVDNEVFEQTLLSKDREEFISMYLDHGFEIHKFTSSSRIVTLFENVLQENFFHEVCWEGVLGYRKIMRLDDDFIDNDLNWIIESLIGVPVYISAQSLNEGSTGVFRLDCPKELSSDMARRKAIIVLVIWALVSNRGKLAIYLWKHEDQPVMLALACCLILDKMQQYINDKTLQDEIKRLSEQFADMALCVFDLCYNDMPTKAYDALSLKNKDWEGHSLLDMAALAQNKKLVAHPCCQKWLTNTFMGNIKLREVPWGIFTLPAYIKVLLCAFFMFPMYLWVRFKDTSDALDADSEYEIKDPYIFPSEIGVKLRVSRDEVGRTHLLKYHYPPMWQMIYWMWSAPITKFWVSHIFYVIYLALFSLAVIWTSCGNFYLDVLICVWTFLIALDSSYRLYALRKAFPNTPVFGTSLEIGYILMYVGFLISLRLGPHRQPYAGKILMCIGLICFYYRLIFIYLPISSTLGPLLYRVKQMVSVDFVNFMKLVALILIANAISMQAILYPDYPLTIEMIRKSFHKAFIAFFMTPVEELKGTEEYCETWEQKPNEDIMCRVSNYIDGKCSSGIAFWPYIIVFQYLLLMKLILMTILFALFSNTGARLGAVSNTLWKFQRYHLVVNFSVSLRLPPPLNIFSFARVLWLAVTDLCSYAHRLMKGKPQEENEEGGKSLQGYIPAFESNYWKQKARNYYTEQEFQKKRKEYVKVEVDIIGKLEEEMNLQEDLMSRVMSQISQLEADMSYTRAHLETLKYRERTGEERRESVSLHCLSRESPYPVTKVQRFPVPDKYVPWEVMWLHYEPSVHTLPKSDFSEVLKPYVDEDMLLMIRQGVEKTDLPSYLWNMEATDGKGIYRNRKSWIMDRNGKPLIYRLDKDNLPRNPKGRTGLQGRGALPRWGPNHNIFTVITRSQKKKSKGSEQYLLDGSTSFDFVETWLTNKKDISLPGGFVWSESRYQTIQSVFRMADEQPTWTTSEEMIQFFKQHADPAKNSAELTRKDFWCEKIYYGYMDDQLNTDQSWKEVELWHVHYSVWNNLWKAFKGNVRWKIMSDDVPIRLPYGQAFLLQEAIRNLEEKIL